MGMSEGYLRLYGIPIDERRSIMSEEKGLKVVVKFSKELYSNDQVGNYARITARVSIKRCAGLHSECQILKKALGAKWDYSYLDEHCETKAEAEHWAAVSCEKIKAEYAIQRARVDSLEVPEDYEIFSDE
jgi:hypothetical protein